MDHSGGAGGSAAQERIELGPLGELYVVGISATTPPNCGSCLRKRCVRHLMHLLTHRLRGLAGARRLPQGEGCVAGIGATTGFALWLGFEQVPGFAMGLEFLPRHRPTVGAGLPAKEVCQAPDASTDIPPSRPRWGSTAPTGRGAVWLGLEPPQDPLCGWDWSHHGFRSVAGIGASTGFRYGVGISATTPPNCGSWLACESGVSGT